VFKLSATGPHRTWAESLLYQFCFLTECSDGAAPVGDLIFDHAGSLYGTTLSGGAYGPGTVFRLTLDINGMWTENVLHSFNYTDGSSPFAGLVFDAAGNLYGTTWWGGDPICDQGCGVVFKLQPTARRRWRETVLHLFSNRPGALPRAGLIFDGHGNLYGTSSGDAMDTWGSVFEITP
jgi:uncharacterized repeat protein (TIGR03803 family)